MEHKEINAFFQSKNISLVLEKKPEKIFYDDEKILLKNTLSKKRQRHVIAGRSCAHLAIKKLSPEKDGPILRGTLGEPLWPEGISGSISHTDQIFAATTAFARDYRGIGIDVESFSSTFEKIRHSLIADLDEIQKLLPFMNQAQALWLLFSLKESFIKCFSPILGKKLSFDACRLLDFENERAVLAPNIPAQDFYFERLESFYQFINPALIFTAVIRNKRTKNFPYNRQSKMV